MSNRISASFSPVSNAGVILFWKTHQAVIGFMCIIWCLIPLFLGGSLFQLTNIPAFFILIISLVTFHGRSLWQIIAIRLGFGVREATGATRWTMSPMSAFSTVGYIDVAGVTDKIIKPVEVVNTDYNGACFLFDKENGQATAVLKMTAIPFLFLSADTQDERALAWSDLLSSLAEHKDIVRIVTQARSLPVENVRDDSFTREEDFSKRDAGNVNSQLHKVMSHDLILTVTVDVEKAQNFITTHGGGIRGISELLKTRLIPIVSFLEDAGIDKEFSILWLNYGQVRGLMKTMVDPSSNTILSKHGELDDTIPVSTSYTEFANEVQVGSMYARTYWIDKFPEKSVYSGFLKQFIVQKTYSMVFTQVWRCIEGHKAQKVLGNRVAELERIKSINERVGRVSSKKYDQELESIRQRLEELPKFNAEVEFQGYVTLISPDLYVLNDQTNMLVTKTSFVHYDRMICQQWVGWLNALPMGLAGRS